MSCIFRSRIRFESPYVYLLIILIILKTVTKLGSNLDCKSDKKRLVKIKISNQKSMISN